MKSYDVYTNSAGCQAKGVTKHFCTPLVQTKTFYYQDIAADIQMIGSFILFCMSQTNKSLEHMMIIIQINYYFSELSPGIGRRGY